MESQDGYETDGVKACMDQELSKDTDPALRHVIEYGNSSDDAPDCCRIECRSESVVKRP